ncbi:hypothetical protein [Lysinibacter sp. HNR]|uniref:hypothetical protein n=1 Tax=Lysinibacter sp. HNR TaxID=3031408 RepID=UPI002434F051|nr:hypothetical protein [Lysinibacter sp. HNR]WGD37947.1 hypothetical protein FrondiHNR_03255 [Lysinibacter sp. HNR]
MSRMDDSARDYDFDIESALEYERTEELQDNLDEELMDDSQQGFDSERRDGFEIIDGFGQVDDGYEPEDGTYDPEGEGFHSEQEPLETDVDLHTHDKWRDSTTVTEGSEVLDEYGEDVSSSPEKLAE